MFFISKAYMLAYTFFVPILYNLYKECIYDLDSLTQKHSFPTFQTIKTKFTVQKTGVWVPFNSETVLNFPQMGLPQCLTTGSR